MALGKIAHIYTIEIRGLVIIVHVLYFLTSNNSHAICSCLEIIPHVLYVRASENKCYLSESPMSTVMKGCLYSTNLEQSLSTYDRLYCHQLKQSLYFNMGSVGLLEIAFGDRLT